MLLRATDPGCLRIVAQLHVSRNMKQSQTENSGLHAFGITSFVTAEAGAMHPAINTGQQTSKISITFFLAISLSSSGSLPSGTEAPLPAKTYDNSIDCCSHQHSCRHPVNTALVRRATPDSSDRNSSKVPTSRTMRTDRTPITWRGQFPVSQPVESIYGHPGADDQDAA